MTKAPLAREAVGPSPTDRGKKGSKRHLLVEEHGIPLSIVVTGANRHDVTQLETVLDNIVIQRPEPEADRLQHLCADKGYDGKPAIQSILDRDYIPHVRRRGEEIEAKKTVPGYRARRWVVEVCHSWLNRFRKILVRCEKTLSSYIALLHLAAAIICWEKLELITDKH
jgi:transposase